MNLENELQQELHQILEYWLNNMVDNENGGFYGRRLFDETLVANAPKGVVLNARILWSFAAAARLTGKSEYIDAAGRAFEYIVKHFYDYEYGGVYWSVNYKGEPLDTKKQVYALSFAMYGFTEFFLLTGNMQAKQLSIELFDTIEKYSHDTKLGGYIEAFTREWHGMEDLRLSNKDANERKTMNTHLHVLEAYANLYRMAPSAELKTTIVHLLDVFNSHIIDPVNHHLGLFFDDNWSRKGNLVSYGHDIEAAWLLCEAADVIGDEYWEMLMRKQAISIADAAVEGIDTDNGIWYEFDPDSNYLVKEKHWWPQSEAMVGFMNAYQLTGREKYLDHVFNSWNFIREHIKDNACGEWKWGVNADYSLMISEDKAGFWKCPYHNSRSCMELIQRIRRLKI